MPAQQMTPLFKQYNRIKSNYRNILLLYRMGDFYELFYEDAERASALLGLTLTKRTSYGSAIPMAGVPVHAIQQYLSRLVRMGESAAVCEQFGDPNSGHLMERKVTQVVTPGTLVDSSLLAEREACIAMAIYDGPVGSGYAWLELASLTLRAGECAPAELSGHIARLAPAELLVAENGVLPEGLHMTIKHLPDLDFDPERAAKKVATKLGIHDLSGLGLGNMPLATACVSAMLDYAEHVQCRDLSSLISISAEHPSDYLYLPPEARRGLELTTSLSEKGPTLIDTIDYCSSAMGSRMLRSRLHHPLVDHRALERRQDAWQALMASDSVSKVRQWLGSCCDLERIVVRISLRRVRPRELAALRETLAALPALHSSLADLDESVAKRFASLLESYEEQLNELQHMLEHEPAQSLREGGVISSRASEELAQLRAVGGDIDQLLEDILAREKQRTDLTALRIGHNRVHGMYFELPRSHAKSAPDYFKRRQTLKHAERYTTEELIKTEREAFSANDRARDIEAKLYAQLVETIAASCEQLNALADALADLDVCVSMAQLAITCGWQRPQYSGEPGISITRGRHPVVESTVDYFEPNSVELSNKRRMMIITGPNMGGKSTYMRQTALIALLAHIGAPVPADSAVIGGLRAIHTRIGAADDLTGGRSTFMVEMSETASILNTAAEGSLVLLDEIGRGTSTYDGLSLAWATADTLLDTNRSMVLLATHYFELAELAQEHDLAENFHMAVGEHNGLAVMLHRLEPGPAGRSFGLQVAKSAGVPEATIADAKRRLDTLLSEAGDRNKQQASLFASGSEQAATEQSPSSSEQVVDKLREADLDGMSPREAQQLLYSLRKIAE